MQVAMIKKMFSGDYIKNIYTLSIGTILAQIIMVAVSPIITRIYTPAELGGYTLVLTIVSILGPNINGKYDMAIVTSKNDKEANSLTVASLFIGLFFTTLVGIILTFVYLISPGIFKEIGLWIYIIIPILFISALTNTLVSYNNKFKQYKLLTSVTIIRSFIHSFGQVIFGFLGMGIAGLFISQVFSSIVGLHRQAKHCIKSFDQIILVKRKQVLLVLKKYKKQPIYSLPANILNGLSYSTTYFSIMTLYGLSEVGYYSLCQRILGLPITLICNNVSRVYFRQANEDKLGKGSFLKIFIKTILLLTVISLPTFFVLFLFADKLFGVIFGSSWEVAGSYVQILSPMFAIRFITIPVINSLIIVGKQKIELITQSLFIVFSIVALLMANILKLPIEDFLVITSVLFSLNYIVILIVIYRASR